MPGCGVYADEFVEEVRLTEGEDHADAAAHRLAHERHLLHPHLAERQNEGSHDCILFRPDFQEMKLFLYNLAKVHEIP